MKEDDGLKFFIITGETQTPLFTYGDKEFTENDVGISGFIQMVNLVKDKLPKKGNIEKIVVDKVAIVVKPISHGLFVIVGYDDKKIDDDHIEYFVSLVGKYFYAVYKPFLEVKGFQVAQRFFSGFKIIYEEIILPAIKEKVHDIPEVVKIKTSIYFSYEPDKTTAKRDEEISVKINIYNGHSKPIYIHRIDDVVLPEAKVTGLEKLGGIERVGKALLLSIDNEVEPGTSRDIHFKMSVRDKVATCLYPSLSISLDNDENETMKISDGTYCFDIN